MLEGKIRLENTLETSVTTPEQHRRILAVMQPNAITLRSFLERNRRDFAAVVDKRQSARHRRQAWRRLKFRRSKAVRLLEESRIRRQFLQTVLEKLKQIARRMEALQRAACRPGFSRDAVRSVDRAGNCRTSSA